MGEEGPGVKGNGVGLSVMCGEMLHERREIRDRRVLLGSPLPAEGSERGDSGLSAARRIAN